MKGTTTASERRADSAAPARHLADAAGAGGVDQCSRAGGQTTVRLESSSGRLAEIAADSDQVQLRVLEVTAGIALERAVRAWGAPIPEGDSPYRIATIAASVAECDESAAGENGGGDRGESAAQDAAPPSTPFGACSDPSCPVCTGKASAPPMSTELVVIPHSPTELVAIDADFRALRSVIAAMQAVLANGAGNGKRGHRALSDSDQAPELDDELEVLGFPDFGPDVDMSTWISDNVPAEDVAETASILGLSIPKAYRNLGIAMTIIHGLPRFADRVRAGEFTMAHVQAAADLCRTVAFRYLPQIDDHLAKRRADVTCDRLRTALRKFISVIEPAEDRSKTAAERRRVDFQTYKNGSACLSLIGPADELYACYRRVEAMARAVRSRRGAAFDLPPGVEIADDRSIEALEYDIMSRPQPKLSIRVRSIDPVTGVQSESEEPLLDDEGNLLFDIDGNGAIVMNDGQVLAAGGADGANLQAAASGPAATAAGTATTAADAATSGRGSAFSASPLNGARIVERRVVIAMPTHHWWLYWQAGVVVTVPFLTVCGQSELPGVLPEGSPIPAETARRIAGYSSTMTRILTDPATGTPLDAKATTYRVPNNVRSTLIAKWAVCSVPGCSRRAATSEIDHIIPFFHLDPPKGGLTRFGNLHPLCKRHHAIKTADRFRVRMLETGEVEYEFRHGAKARSRPPDQPIDVAHALEFGELCGLSPGPATIPDHLIPPPKDTADVTPEESAVRERDEAIRLAEEAAERDRRLAESIERSDEARRQKRLSDYLSGRSLVCPASLPPGSDPVTMKRLMPGKRESTYSYLRRKEEAGDSWAEPLDGYWATSRLRSVPRVQWEHDYADDPPPF